MRAGWCSPWLAVERVGKARLAFGRALAAGKGQTLHRIDLHAELPRANCRWNGDEPQLEEVGDLLGMADDD